MELAEDLVQSVNKCGSVWALHLVGEVLFHGHHVLLQGGSDEGGQLLSGSLHSHFNHFLPSTTEKSENVKYSTYSLCTSPALFPKWSTVEHVQETGTVEPVQETSTVEPVQETSTVEPVQETGTVEPVQETSRT